MSPPVRGGCNWSPLNFGRSTSASGPPGGETITVDAVLDEQPRAEAERDRQPRRRKTQRRSAVRPFDADIVAERARRLARRHPLRGVRPQPQHRRHLVDRLGDEVEGDEVAVRLLRRRDAALVLAEERFAERGPPGASGAAARATFPSPAPASNPPAPASNPRRDGPPLAGWNGQLTSRSRACSTRPRHSRTHRRPGSWRCRTGRRCPAASAPCSDRSSAP